MDLKLKDIKLPKDPLDSDQEQSGDESPHEKARRKLNNRLEEMPKIEYKIPQNMVTILGGLNFGD